MLHLITGGSGSGKSMYGEKLILDSKAFHRYYVATMHPWGKEGEERVQRHQKQREGKGFETLEVYDHLELAAIPSNDWEHTAVLLECMSNLAANELFDVGGFRKEILKRIHKGIQHLQDCAKDVIVVTNNVFMDGVVYEEDTMNYLRLLAQINRELAEKADRVTEVVYGIPIPIKSEDQGMEKERRFLCQINSQ